MSDEQKPKLKFKTNIEEKVVLTFDSPQTGTSEIDGKSFDWTKYGCTHNGEEKVFFASGRLHQMIQLCGFSRGDSFTVLKKEDDDQQFPFFTINGKTFDTLQEAKNIETATAPNTDEDIPF